ncbi:MAG: AraC family transcriptional regulator [Verrucomicrobiota bacterium]
MKKSPNRNRLDTEFFGPVPWQRDIYVNRIGFDSRGPYYQQTIPSTADTTIALVLSGRGRFETPKKQFSLATNSVFIRQKDFPITISSNGNAPLRLFIVGFSGKEIIDQVHHLFSANSVVIGVKNHERVYQAFLSIHQLAKQRGSYAHESCCCALELLIFILKEERIALGRSARTLQFRTFQRCRSYLDQHFIKLHSIGEAAVGCKVSQAHLCKLFKAHTDLTPYQYLLNLKIQESKRLLRESSLTVQEISDHLNFADPFNFSRCFKRISGTSPSFYRHDI